MKRILLLLISLASWSLIAAEHKEQAAAKSSDSESKSNIYEMALNPEFQAKYRQQLDQLLPQRDLLNKIDQIRDLRPYRRGEDRRILVFARTQGGFGDILNAVKVAKHLVRQGREISLCIETIRNGKKTYHTNTYPCIRTITTEAALMKFIDPDEWRTHAHRVVITPDLFPESLEWRKSVQMDWLHDMKERMVSLTEYNRPHGWGQTTGFGKGKYGKDNWGILQLSHEEIRDISPLESLYGILPFKRPEKFYFAYAKSDTAVQLPVLTKYMEGIINANSTEEKHNFIFLGVSLAQIDQLKAKLANSIKANYIIYDNKGKVLGRVKSAASPKVKIVTGFFEHEQVLTLLKHAEDPVLTTGDQSFSEAVSMRKITFYEVNKWKTDFALAFMDDMNQAYPKEFLFDLEDVIDHPSDAQIRLGQLFGTQGAQKPSEISLKHDDGSALTGDKLSDFMKQIMAMCPESSTLEKKTIKEDQCSICYKKGPLKCSKCKARFYCSKECQKADWPKHKNTCTKK